MKKCFLYVLLTIMFMLGVSGCGGGGTSTNILPDKIENVSTEPSVPENAMADEHDNSKYPLEFLGGVWVVEGFTENPDETTASAEKMTLKTEEGNKEVEVMPIQLNLMPYKENPFEDIGVGYGELLYKKTKYSDNNYLETFYEVPIIYDTHENTLAFGTISEELKCEDGVFTDEEGNMINELTVEEAAYEIEWTGWNLKLKNGKQEVNYIPQDIDAGVGVSFETSVKDSLGWDAGKGLSGEGLIEVHEDYEAMDEIIRIKPASSSEGLLEEKGNIQFYLQKPYIAQFAFEDDGIVKIDAMDNGEFAYNFLYSGRSLVLMNDEKTSLYSVYAEKSEVMNSGIGMDLSYFDNWANQYNVISMADLQMGTQNIAANGEYLSFWIETGASTSQDLQELLAPGEIAEVELSLDGNVFDVKVINTYDTHVEYKEAEVAGIYLDSSKCNIMFGVGSDSRPVYGVSTMQDVFDYWNEIPFEKGEGYLNYKSADGIGISSIKLFFLDDKNLIIEDDHEREVKFLFKDGVLTGVEIIAPSLLYSGLQDNIATDELIELTPSYIADVTVVRDTILSELKEAFDEAEVDVDINEATGEIVMPNDILFDTDEYELNSKGKEYIDRFMKVYAKVLLKDKFADVVSEIAIDGHCDPTGSDAYNQVLSQNRADSVKQWCLDSTTNKLTDKQKTRLSEKAKTKGYSFSDPVYDSDGDIDNDASRRVTIKFFIDMEAAGNVTK